MSKSGQMNGLLIGSLPGKILSVVTLFMLWLPSCIWADNLFKIIPSSTDQVLFVESARLLTIDDINTAGANINYRTEDGKTALMFVAEFNENPNMIEALLSAGANVNDADERGWTALMGAAKSNENLAVMTALLTAGANVNDRAEGGATVLTVAVQWNKNPAVIEALLASGAKVNYCIGLALP